MVNGSGELIFFYRDHESYQTMENAHIERANTQISIVCVDIKEKSSWK